MKSTLGLRALEIAKNLIGFGEELGNNLGAFIEKLRAGDGTGLPADTAEPWCASTVGYCLRKAGYTGRTSRSALRLVDFLERDGGIRLSDPVPGAVIAWRHRWWQVARFSRRGHTGIVEEYDPEMPMLAFVDGNSGKSPQKVARRYRADWRKLLYKIVLPNDKLTG